MLDFSHVPSNQQDRQIFYATVGSNTWQTWRKPRGAKMIQIFCLAGGGGGGAGVTNSNISYAASGGSGGGSGAFSQGLYPAFLLPDILYIQVGLGGIGGITRNQPGSNGSISYVSITPSISPNSSIQQSGGGGGGGLGGAAGGQNGGTAGYVWSPLTSSFSSLAIISSLAGVAGGASVITAATPSVTALSQSIVTGGTAGGGRNGAASVIGYSGGTINASNLFLQTSLNGGPGSGDANTTASYGQNGYGLLSPIFCGTGGTGGGASYQSIGGNGGNGFYGCGGGGGGCSDPSDAPVGRGGRGGDGLVIITSIF